MKRYIWLLPLLVLMAAGFRTSGYRSDNTIHGNYTFTDGITINNPTAGVDTALYIKHYGSRTGDYGIVVDMDTSANTAANVIGIDMSGSNAIDGGSDYFLWLNSINWWRGDGNIMIQGKWYFLNTGLQIRGGNDLIFDWQTGNKGDLIFRDGNLATGTVNLNFIQVQDSAGTANLNIPNKGIRGHLHFAGNCLVDTIPGVTGVTDNSFVFLTWKGTAAPTSPLAWKYLGVDSIAVYCAIADSTAGRVSGYNWFRVE